MATISVSQTQVNDFRACQQLFWYRHVRKIQPKQPVKPLELGTMLHEYLGIYYQAIKDGSRAKKAHRQAHKYILDTWTDTCLGMAAVTHDLGGDPKVIEEFETMPDDASLMMERYFVVHGEQDAKDYDIELVEEPLKVRLSRGLNSSGIADMVTRNRMDGCYYLWEHKSTTDVPSGSYRMRDMQTLLYNAELRAIYPEYNDVRGVVWNYINTVRPRVPELLKKGQLSQDTKMNTTWFVYNREIEAQGLDPADYEKMHLALQYREKEVFFPRPIHTIVAREDVVLRDFIQTAEDIKRVRAMWEKGTAAPVKTLSRSCDWCSFNLICNADITSGNIDDVIDLRFIKQAERVH